MAGAAAVPGGKDGSGIEDDSPAGSGSSTTNVDGGWSGWGAGESSKIADDGWGSWGGQPSKKVDDGGWGSTGWNCKY